MTVKILKNTSGIPTADVRKVLRFVRPDNLTVPTVATVTRASCHVRGRYLGYRIPRIVLRVGNVAKPYRQHIYQYAQHRGKRLVIRNRIEALVYVAAHETRHLWQEHGRCKNSSFPHGYVRNAKGRFSEVDTEAYAIHMLRKWRRS